MRQNGVRAVISKTMNFIPVNEPLLDGNEKKYLNNCIDTTFVSSVGQYVDRMEQMGYVSAPEGQKPRRVLITKEQYMELVLKQEDII